MNSGLWVLAACLAACAAAQAGHGFMNSFGDIEWLPEPGTTPDDFAYSFDRIGERAELALAGSSAESLALCLEFAREKLAEISAMVKADDAQAAAVAVAHYRDYVERAAAAVAALPPAQLAEHRARYINALLEHVYIMSVDYVDMPLGIRQRSLSPLFEAAMRQFEAQRAALSKDEREALFFKEEEIRWSLEMTQQADEQKIVN